MKIKIILFLYLFVFIGYSTVFAQCKGDIIKYTTTSKKAQKCYEKAQSLINIKAYNEAIEELNKALSYDERFIEAYLVLGDVYTYTREFDKAEDVYKKALQINPNFFTESYYLLGNIEFNSGKYDEAYKYYKTRTLMKIID